MEWRIRECGHGGFTVEGGITHKGGARVPGLGGFTMSAFIVYESAHFDTRKEAQRFVRRRRANG